MAKLILIRHVESTANVLGLVCGRLDVDLSSRGLKQIESLQFLSTELPQEFRLLSSPLSRAVKTARALVKDFQKIEIREELNEINAGELSSLSYAELYEQYPEYKDFARRKLTFPKGEALADVERRVLSLLGSLSDLRDRDYLVVSHSGLINLILHTLLQIPLAQFPAFVIENGNAVELFWDEEVKIWKMNRQNFRMAR